MEKEVIIIGDGPSIRHYDLSSIDENIDRIYCGSQILHKNFNINKSINSNYIIIEPRLLWPDFMLDKKRYYLKDERQKIKRILKGFESNPNVNYYLHWTNAPFVFNLRNIKLVSNKKTPFTTNLSHITGSFSACISLANYLGYDKIHLLGFDSFVLNKSANNRWYEKLGPITKNNSKNAVQFIINKFHHMNFKVVSEHELILDSSKLMKSDLNIKYNKNRFNLIDLVNKNDIEIMSMSKYINIDI